jgi:hypothetical protein
MHVKKSVVTAALRRQGDHDRALQAECLLPGHVDTERDANLLRRLDVDIHELENREATTSG